MADANRELIKKEINSLFPNSNYRKRCLSLYREIIEIVDQLGNNKWGTYHFKDGIRLLVGNLIIFTIHKNGIWLALDKQSLDEEKEKRKKLDNNELWHWWTGEYSVYKSVPSINGYYYPHDNDSDIWPIIKELHIKYLTSVVNRYKALNIKSQLKHSDELLWYVQNELGIESIPIPHYCDDEFEIPEEIDVKTDKILTEGAKKQITVNAYERNPIARKKCLQRYGFSCIVCNFDFEEVYGEIGRGYIHVHHLKPLNEINSEYHVDPIKDLIPVCPNCHSMLHRGDYSIEQLRDLLVINKNKPADL